MLFLIEKGAEVDAVGGELSATPLHWATRQGHLDAGVILMNSGADPTLRDAEGCSCIHLAAQFGHTALVKSCFFLLHCFHKSHIYNLLLHLHYIIKLLEKDFIRKQFIIGCIFCCQRSYS